MKIQNKLYLFTIFAVIVFITAGVANAADPTVGNQICKIRWLFCGAVRTTLLAVAIISIGFMILAGRMQWGTALVILFGMILFANAEYFAFMFTTMPRCFCAPTPLI